MSEHHTGPEPARDFQSNRDIAAQHLERAVFALQASVDAPPQLTIVVNKLTLALALLKEMD